MKNLLVKINKFIADLTIRTFEFMVEWIGIVILVCVLFIVFSVIMVILGTNKH